MEVIKYTYLESLRQSSEQQGVALFYSGVSYSFRIFDDVGNTKQFHVFYFKF